LFRTHRLKWQENYYDHHLRPREKLLPIFLYVFLNPYRAGLLRSNEKWPWYECSEDDWAWFGSLTNEACPFPEWL
jgi:hypothetical protein